MKKNLLIGGMVLSTLVGILTVPSLAWVGQKVVQADYHNMKVTLNGQTIPLTDSQGNPVEPFTIDGTTYLPLASVSKALGLNVSWDGANNTVVLTTGSASNPGTGTATNPSTTTDIGVEKAKSIALNHAGLTASNVTFLKAQLDYDDGVKVYDVEFWSGNKEYDYEVNAATGAIHSYDFDVEGFLPSTGTNTGTYLTEAQVKAIVEQKAGTTGTYREFKLDWDDGRAVYEGKLRSGWLEYEFEIDAATGTVLSWELD